MGLLYLTLSLAACSGAANAAGPDAEALLTDTILVAAPSTRVAVGGALQLDARVRDEQGRARDDLPVAWISSSPDVAAVSEFGLVRGVSSGQVTISVSTGNHRGEIDLEVASHVASEPLRAFPGADGWGAEALNECRFKPLQVLRVTNLASEGVGSFAKAVEDARSDRFSFILFETGGHIKTPRDAGIRLNSSCVYIAGQTAPGDGVVIQGQSTAFWLRGGGANISDIVMRYLRFRGKAGVTRNNIIIAKGERIVLDHMSFSWTDNYILSLLRYGDMTFSDRIADVSIQNSIASEVFATHPTGPVFGTNEQLKAAARIDMENISLHRNLWAHNSHRNPMTAADNTLVVNNVIYNWSIGAGMMNRRGTADWVNNHGKAGPMTREDNSYLVNAYCDELGGDFSIYAAGNISPMSDDPDGDNWTGSARQVACYHNTGEVKGQELPSRWKRDSEQGWRSARFPVDLLPTRSVFDSVLEEVGANERLKCDGTWTSAADPVDRRIVAETRSGTGVANPPVSEGAVGGYPSYAQGSRCDDEDLDGLPDEWEERFFNCETCASPEAIGSGGYLLIEHYVNGTRP